jgi:hypothetical protein
MKARIKTAQDKRDELIKDVMGMSDTDLRAWKRTEKLRMKEYEATANAMLISLLYYLMTKEKRGAVTLRRAWEGMILARAEARRELRIQDGEYVLAATGKNVEDYYMYEELRKKGADVLAWERAVRMDDEGNVFFSDKETWR